MRTCSMLTSLNGWRSLLGFAVLSLQACASAETLTVALYPYVPERHEIFTTLEAEFERKNPGVDLVLSEPPAWNRDYYSEQADKLASETKGDVFEIDTLRLSDYVEKDLIASLPSRMTAGVDHSLLEAVTRSGHVYAIPRWLCGKVLVYRAGSEDIEKAQTLDELFQVAAAHQQTILADVYGTTTIGEWYLSLLADKKGIADAQADVLAAGAPDSDVMSTLARLLDVCPYPYCRSSYDHEAAGFYAREFARGKAVAYIGYSETLHYAIDELTNNCGPGSSCIDAKDIRVKALPRMTRHASNPPLGWVDGLAISAKLTGRKKHLAEAFVIWATSSEVQSMVLGSSPVPKYLVPATRDFTHKDAPLYPQIYEALKERSTGTESGLNSSLRQLVKQSIHCQLPRSDCTPK